MQMRRPTDHDADRPTGHSRPSAAGRRLPSPAAAGLVLAALSVWACSEAQGPSTGPEPSALRAAAMTPPEDHSLFLRDVEIRPGITADLHVRMFVNEAMPCRDPSRTALAIHGINHTAASWETLVDAFFTGSPRDRLCAVAALDHPGHGRSGLPEGDPEFTFGQLTVEDYARGVLEVMDRMARRGIRPSIVMGHSQGTSTLQAVQQRLLAAGTGLADRFGVRDVVFFGTQGPREVPVEWTLPDEAVAERIASLITTTPEKGTFVAGPPRVFLENWFINRDLVLSSDAPTLRAIAEAGWNEDIPLAAVLQAAGQDGFRPPSARAGAFGPGTGLRLHVVHFTDDPWSLNAGEIYEHLTGDASRAGFVPLEDPDDEAVHDYQITDPGVVRAALELPRVGSERAAR